MYKKEILKVLDKNSEREIAKFLKLNPKILLWGFCRTGGNAKYIVTEFPLGRKYRADFVIPFGYSGAWRVHFIEFKSPSDEVFTRQGRPTKSFSQAISQIYDWKDIIDKRRREVQEDLADMCMKSDLLNFDSHDFPITNGTGQHLHDINTAIFFNFHIIIGRRENITKEIRKKMNQYINSTDIEIGTYDRFVDIANNFDAYYANPNNSVYLPVTDN